MRRREREPDPEQQRRQSRADDLLHEVGLRLLAEARRLGSFPTDSDGLGQALKRIGAEWDDTLLLVRDGEPAWEAPADFVLEVTEAKADRLGLECRYPTHCSVLAELRLDGVLENSAISFGFGGEGPGAEHTDAIAADEQEVLRKAAVAFKADRERGVRPFRGGEFHRAIPVSPQAESPIQLLAIELYGDGLVVHYQYDDPVDVRPAVPLNLYVRAGVAPPIDAQLAEAEEAGGTPAPAFSIADDLGTVYSHSGGQAGGLHVMHGSERFVPRVPPEARELRIASYAGEIVIELAPDESPSAGI